MQYSSLRLYSSKGHSTESHSYQYWDYYSTVFTLRFLWTGRAQLRKKKEYFFPHPTCSFSIHPFIIPSIHPSIHPFTHFKQQAPSRKLQGSTWSFRPQCSKALWDSSLRGKPELTGCNGRKQAMTQTKWQMEREREKRERVKKEQRGQRTGKEREETGRERWRKRAWKSDGVFTEKERRGEWWTKRIEPFFEIKAFFVFFVFFLGCCYLLLFTDQSMDT